VESVGRIKTALIKRITNQLVKEHRDKFTKKFEENKKLVEQFADIPSKKIRNIIAGYVTRLKQGKIEELEQL
jgi:small subunit ribosomal protein S17e